MGKNLLKKTVAAACTLTLALSAVTVRASAEGMNLASNVTKPQKITVMWDNTLATNDENPKSQAAVVAKYKELTGVELELIRPSHNEYQEKVNLAFTAGNVPDALILPTNLYLKYANYGALADITDLYEGSQAKKNYIDQGYVDALRLDGRLYGLPQAAGNGCVTYVRGDWLDTLNMEMPTNYDEFIGMLQAFKDNDMNGNGKDDTIPYTGAGLANNEFPLDIYLREFYQDATPDFVLRDGLYVDGMLLPEMREALERMTSAFSAGLIDKEIITNNTTSARNKYYEGNVGVFNYWAGGWNNTIMTNITKNVKDARVVAMPAIEGVKYIERPAVPFSITYKCENIPGVFKYFLEFMVDEGAGQHLFTYGVEGATYNMVNGKIDFLPKEDGQGTFAKSFIDGALGITHFKDIVTRPDVVIESTNIYRDGCQYYSLFPVSAAYSNYITDLNDMRKAAIAKIVYGDSTIDAELAKYEIDSQGYVAAILADFNKGK